MSDARCIKQIAFGLAFTVLKEKKGTLYTKNQHVAFQDVFIVSGDDTCFLSIYDSSSVSLYSFFSFIPRLNCDQKSKWNCILQNPLLIHI